MAERADQLVVTQQVEARLEAVWEAWTTERGLASWWWAGWDDTTYRVDLRVGGSYRIEVPSVSIAVSGRYEAVEAPTRLVMTWVWEEDDEGSGPLEHVVVEFESTEGSTLVTVTHTGPWTTPNPAENYRQGWNHVLGALACSAGDTTESRKET